MRVTLIGANGFVGSAFARMLTTLPDLELVAVTRQNYNRFAGTQSDLVVEAACNSRKYLADEQPQAEFDASVAHRLRTLLDFPALCHLHISSADVYSDLASLDATREDTAPDPAKTSRYGLHKLLAEQLVRHYADKWLIVRLAGMVGPGMKKNPVFDILHQQPLRIHPDSKYQFIQTDAVARIAWGLVQSGAWGEIFNVCGQGLISPREIAEMAGRPLKLGALNEQSQPRIVNINVTRISKKTPMPATRETIRQFLEAHRAS